MDSGLFVQALSISIISILIIIIAIVKRNKESNYYKGSNNTVKQDKTTVKRGTNNLLPKDYLLAVDAEKTSMITDSDSIKMSYDALKKLIEDHFVKIFEDTINKHGNNPKLMNYLNKGTSKNPS